MFLGDQLEEFVEPRQIDVNHDVWMERMPLDGPNGGHWCEYNDINVYDVVMSEIPWFVSGEVGST